MAAIIEWCAGLEEPMQEGTADVNGAAPGLRLLEVDLLLAQEQVANQLQVTQCIHRTLALALNLLQCLKNYVPARVEQPLVVFCGI
jgi:hypothetical protein